MNTLKTNTPSSLEEKEEGLEVNQKPEPAVKMAKKEGVLKKLIQRVGPKMRSLILIGEKHGFDSPEFFATTTSKNRVELRLRGIEIPRLRIIPDESKGTAVRKSYKCALCSKEFTATKHFQKNHYCSRICYHTSVSGSANPHYKGGPVNQACKICGKTFAAKRNVSERRLTCSPECHKEALSRRRKKVCRVQQNLNRLVRNSILNHLKRGVKNYRKWRDVLGFTPAELKVHLESQFLEGMSWDNHGVYGWHIDHVRPVSSFRFTTMEDPDFHLCWSLNNLQPLWARDNLIKSDKYDINNR